MSYKNELASFQLILPIHAESDCHQLTLLVVLGTGSISAIDCIS